MANQHISIPKSLLATGWSSEVNNLKFSTLLKGETLAVWLELSKEEQQDVARAKEKMIQKMVPTEFYVPREV